MKTPLAPAILALLLAVMPAIAGQGSEMGPRRARPVAQAEDPSMARVIVKYRSGSALMQTLSAKSATRVLPQHAAALGQRLGYALQDGRVLGERMQAMRGQGLPSSALVAKLRQQADVEWAVVDERRTIQAAPNDPLYGPEQTSTTPTVGQWYLRAPDATAVSAINAAAAWDITKGSSSVTVAVLDTGVRFDHPDLAGKLYPGYDFISTSSVGGDGDGRDADASDPGDYTAAGECGRGSAASSSSWHGTATAGIVGAATDNAIGMASVGRDVMVLPVRVIGKCGGYDSDIIAAMYWAAGLSTTPVVNAHPARVINMSLGGSGACQASYQQVFTDLVAAGVSVVVAAGNDEGLAVGAPANCNGAIAVAAVRHVGTKVGFSNLGPEVAISAPGGNCVNTSGLCLYALTTTSNAGTTTPTTSTYLDSVNYEVGTSFSTPMVAGTIALMLSVNPTLTLTQIRSALRSSARPFPTTGALTASAPTCRAPTSAVQDECYCTTSTCGAGLLDVAAAVAAVAPASATPPQPVIAVSNASPTAGDTVTLNAAGSTVGSGRSIAAYQWQISTGGTLAAFSGVTNGSTAALLTSGAGAVTVTLVVTDSTGASGSASSVINVQAAPVAAPPAATGGGGGGGGGAFSVLWMALLALAAFCLRRVRHLSTYS